MKARVRGHAASVCRFPRPPLLTEVRRTDLLAAAAKNRPQCFWATFETPLSCPSKDVQHVATGHPQAPFVLLDPSLGVTPVPFYIFYLEFHTFVSMVGIRPRAASRYLIR